MLRLNKVISEESVDGIKDLQRVLDATDRLDAAYILRYAIDFDKAAKAAAALGVGMQAQELVKIAASIADKFNRMDSIISVARNQLRAFPELR